MRMLVKNRPKETIALFPDDHVQVSLERSGERRVVADIKVREADIFNTAFIAALEPGGMGFARGYVGGIVQEVCNHV